MAIYTYKCKDCGTVFDFLKMKNVEQPRCEECGGNNLEKIVTAPGAVIMGASNPKGTTCCGKNGKCDVPPCSYDGSCKRE